MAYLDMRVAKGIIKNHGKEQCAIDELRTRNETNQTCWMVLIDKKRTLVNHSQIATKGISFSFHPLLFSQKLSESCFTRPWKTNVKLDLWLNSDRARIRKKKKRKDTIYFHSSKDMSSDGDLLNSANANLGGEHRRGTM